MASAPLTSRIGVSWESLASAVKAEARPCGGVGFSSNEKSLSGILTEAVGAHRGAALFGSHSHLSLPPPYKATRAADPLPSGWPRKAIRHYAWSDHIQCGASLGKLTDQA